MNHIQKIIFEMSQNCVRSMSFSSNQTQSTILNGSEFMMMFYWIWSGAIQSIRFTMKSKKRGIPMRAAKWATTPFNIWQKWLLISPNLGMLCNANGIIKWDFCHWNIRIYDCYKFAGDQLSMAIQSRGINQFAVDRLIFLTSQMMHWFRVLVLEKMRYAFGTE